ncbi:MAG: DUF5916 domain-containing protein [Acidobacteriota bacterium]
MPRPIPFLCVVGILTAPPGTLAMPQAQDALGERPAVEGPMPVPPATVARDEAGRVTVRAVRIDSTLRIDGHLDEEQYRQTPPIDGFLQQEPREGEPSTESTEVWLFFDEGTIYVAARLHDSRASEIVANEMRRDSFNIFQNDNFGVIFDTFHDRRNGFFFYTNAVGGLSDQTVTDGRESNREWNTVWDCRTSRDDEGWSVEMAIPFRSLRYAHPGEQVWGINFRRTLRSRNEYTYLTRIPAAYGMRGMQRLSSAATLVGLVAPPSSLNLEVKPYVASVLRTDKDAEPAMTNDLDATAGVDVKYGITQGLTADFSINTDFAQVEEDEQQVNLTRFSLFFPERRDFFLEGQGIFAFGGGARGGGMGPPSNTPVLFYSRRIGLQEGETIPMHYGARVTGKAGPYSIGILSARTGGRDLEAGRAHSTNFLVARVKRDIFRRSSIGAIFTRRGPSIDGLSPNYAVGLDGNFVFFQNLSIDAYIARTDTPALNGDAMSYRGALDYMGDRYGLRVEHLHIGPDFNPEAGFVRRENVDRSLVQGRFSPRPAHSSRVRKYQFEAQVDYFESTAGIVETREIQGLFGIDFQSGDEWRIEGTSTYEYLDEPFEVTEGAFIPAGGYRFADVRTSLRLGSQRKASGNVAAGHGRFYDGTRTEASFRGRIELTPQLAVEPGISVNWIDLPVATYRNDVISARVNYAISPRTILSGLVQYNSNASAISSSVRFRWEYRPGSDLFLVYSEGRDTSRLHGPVRLANHSVALKFTRLFR